MTPSDDLSPPRRQIFFPVVIATVFLTIIGMTAGFLLGEQRRDRVNAGAQQSSEPQAQPQPLPADSSSRSGRECPAETQTTARRVGVSGPLWQVMKIETDNGSTVWICTDNVGAFYYQGKTGGSDAPITEGTNALFLTSVDQVGTDHYEVLDHKGNRFVITRKRLELHFTDDRVERHDVVTDE